MGKRRKPKPHRAAGASSGKPSAARQAQKQSSQSSQRRFPVPGLSNLGNTCFFNAVVQNIGQTHFFGSQLVRMKNPYEMTITLPRPSNDEELVSRRLTVNSERGPLTMSLMDLLDAMKTGLGRTVNPREVFTEVSKQAPRFRGYQQQDSQELLRYLLDSLRMEEVKRIKRSILDSFGVGKSMKALSEKAKAEIKAFGREADQTRTVVDQVFGGKLLSTVICSECGSRSDMQEDFLDLCLPMPEDKGKGGVSSPSPKGNYQTRNKKDGGKGSGKVRGQDYIKLKAEEKEEEGEGEREGEGEVLFSPKGPSKHQLKKARAQARKASKKGRSKNISLQEFQSSDFSNITTHCDHVTSESNKDSQALTDQQTNVCATQEMKEAEADCNNTAEDPSDSINHKDIVPAASQMPTKELSDLSIDASSVNAVDDKSPKEKASSVGESLVKQAESEGGRSEEVHEKDKRTQEDLGSMLSLGWEDCSEENSVLSCLKKFCTRELLTGSNKFACMTCSERGGTVGRKGRKAPENEEEIRLRETGSGTTSAQEDVFERTKREPANVRSVSRKDQQKHESEESGNDTDDSGSDLTLPSDYYSNKEESAKESDGYGEASSLLSEEEGRIRPKGASAQTDKDKESESSMVFCEATKQLLIDSLPDVLVLYLKRFIQLGRHTRKNNRSVAFPFVLDMAPFCTQRCKKMCDSNGKILYALYGIVEHSGGIHGGHYVANVRVRPEIVRDLDRSSPCFTGNDSDSSRSVQCTESCSKEESLKPGLSSMPMPPQRRDDVDQDVCVEDGDVCSSQSRHDLSSLEGQWYSISDSHVKTISKEEVKKSQAYLLFYERLPLKLHNKI